jgi:parvulin-like peptidyl-prolyl isomerase
MIAKTLLSLFILLQPGQIMVDKIAAIVNNEIITIHDIERAIAFYPLLRQNNEAEGNFYFRVLSDLINFKIISLEFNDEFKLSEEDFEQVQTPILKKAGSMEKLLAILNNFTMNWSDFQNFIREKVLYEKVLREKFQMEITVPFSDIERFYRDDYFPSQQRLGLAPQTLVEMAPVIEKYLRQLRTAEQLSTWLSELRANYQIEIKLRSRP